MDRERYDELMNGPDPQELTMAELAEGWHWCPEMDDLLCQYGSEDCFCGGATGPDQSSEESYGQPPT